MPEITEADALETLRQVGELFRAGCRDNGTIMPLIGSRERNDVGWEVYLVQVHIVDRAVSSFLERSFDPRAIEALTRMGYLTEPERSGDLDFFRMTADGLFVTDPSFDDCDGNPFRSEFSQKFTASSSSSQDRSL